MVTSSFFLLMASSNCTSTKNSRGLKRSKENTEHGTRSYRRRSAKRTTHVFGRGSQFQCIFEAKYGRGRGVLEKLIKKRQIDSTEDVAGLKI